MNSRLKHTRRDYTLALKLSVVEQVEKGDPTHQQTQARYGIQGRTTLLVWRRKHGRLGWVRLRRRRQPCPLTKPPSRSRPRPCKCSLSRRSKRLNHRIGPLCHRRQRPNSKPQTHSALAHLSAFKLKNARHHVPVHPQQMHHRPVAKGRTLLDHLLQRRDQRAL